MAEHLDAERQQPRNTRPGYLGIVGVMADPGRGADHPAADLDAPPASPPVTRDRRNREHVAEQREALEDTESSHDKVEAPGVGRGDRHGRVPQQPLDVAAWDLGASLQEDLTSRSDELPMASMQASRTRACDAVIPQRVQGYPAALTVRAVLWQGQAQPEPGSSEPFPIGQLELPARRADLQPKGSPGASAGAQTSHTSVRSRTPSKLTERRKKLALLK